MKKLISLSLLLLISFAVLGQKQDKAVKKALKNANKVYDEAVEEYRVLGVPYMFEEAIAPLHEVVELDPDNAEANYKLGKCYEFTIYKTKALRYLEKAYKANPAIAEDILWLLGKAYQYNHQFDKALEKYKAYKASVDLEEDPDFAKVLDRKIYECNNGIEYLKNPVNVKIENLGANINSKYMDYAPVITPDESILVFTSRREGSTGEQLAEDGKGFYEDVYISTFENGAWTTPRNLGKKVNSKGHDASIAISGDGNHIYIYKDEKKDGGDLFKTDFEEEDWSKPEPLKEINSKYREASVTLSADGNTLYFASDRPGGHGGMDIWMSTKDEKGNWTDPQNLGDVINTEYDDDAPFIHPDGRTLYFSSKGHKGMGSFDIYRTVFKDGKWSEPENLGYPINTANADIYFVLSANNKHGYYATYKEDGYGREDIYKISMPQPKRTASVTKKNLTLKSKGLEKKEIVEEVEEVLEPANPITILKGTITDALTKEPLKAKIILVDNEKNKVISEFESNPKTGNYLIVIQSGKNYGISVNKEEYLFHSENFDIPQSTDYQEVRKDVELKKVAVGSRIILKNIFFDFDKATLRDESVAELQRLKKLLEDVPDLKIEISGHTDNKGLDAYNKSLSERRAKAVMDYLVEKGIDKERLTYKGYGEERPIATNDTDEGRQLNRRTEFEIIAN